MGTPPTYHPPEGGECETSVEHGLRLWAEPALGYCSQQPRPSPMWGSRFGGARAVGPWVGERKPLGKTPLRGNPSPESTYLPTVRRRQGLGTLRAHTRPSGRRLFRSRQGLRSLPGAHTSLWTAAGVAWHLSSCRGSVHVMRALRVCGTLRPLLLRTCPCALVRAGGVPLWRAPWPHVVRRASSGPVALGAPVGRGAFPHPGGLRPRLYRVAVRGTRRPAENGAHCVCRWPPPRQGRWARSASYPFGAPRWGCSWRVPPASVLGCVRCGGWRLWTRSLTRPVSRTVRRSTGD